MKPLAKTQANFLVFAAPAIASTCVAIAPVQAASIGFSQSVSLFDNFSHAPCSTDVLTQTDTLALAGPISSTTASALAEAFFAKDLPGAGTFSETQASGKGKSYLGLGQSTAAVVGNFSIGAREAFSFNFLTALYLEAATDNPSQEMASAAANIAFWLFGSQAGGEATLLDSFSVFSRVTTAGSSSLVWESTDNISYASDTRLTASGAIASSEAGFQGWYQRTFDSPTQLTLVQITENEASATVPEPPTPFVLPFMFFLTCLGFRSRRIS